MTYAQRVCGTASEKDILAESICKHCKQKIFRTVNFVWLWRHRDGFSVCIATWDNTKPYVKGNQNLAVPV